MRSEEENDEERGERGELWAREEAAAKINADGKNLKSTLLSCLDSNMSRVQPFSAASLRSPVSFVR